MCVYVFQSKVYILNDREKKKEQLNVLKCKKCNAEKPTKEQ